MDIAVKIKNLRESLGWSKNRLANEASISQAYVSQLEDGQKRPGIDILEKICQAAGITVIDFLSENIPTDHIPPDITQFSIDKNNHSLIRLIQGMQASGYSNEIIKEWIVSLNMTLDNITDQLKKRYGIGKGEGQTRWVDEDLLPEEERGKYSEEEKRELTEKLKKKLGRNL